MSIGEKKSWESERLSRRGENRYVRAYAHAFAKFSLFSVRRAHILFTLSQFIISAKARIFAFFARISVRPEDTRIKRKKKNAYQSMFN